MIWRFACFRADIPDHGPPVDGGNRDCASARDDAIDGLVRKHLQPKTSTAGRDAGARHGFIRRKRDALDVQPAEDCAMRSASLHDGNGT